MRLNTGNKEQKRKRKEIFKVLRENGLLFSEDLWGDHNMQGVSMLHAWTYAWKLLPAKKACLIDGIKPYLEIWSVVHSIIFRLAYSTPK